MRLIIPEVDRDRSYHLKEKLIAENYIKCLEIAKTDKDALLLENWRNTEKACRLKDTHATEHPPQGDFPAMVRHVLGPRVYDPKSAGKTDNKSMGGPSIVQVNDWLDQLSECDGSKEKDRKRKVFTEMCNKANMMTGEMHYWITKIVLKDLKLGSSSDFILKIYHPQASQHYDSCQDLRKVLKDLASFDHCLPTGESISIFQQFKPMLASRCDQKSLVNMLQKGGEVAIEDKLDGERLIVHKKGDKIELYSRKGTDYTETYKNIQEHIRKATGKSTECILDGELLAWDPKKNKYTAFGTLKTVAENKPGEHEHCWLCYVVFDILWHNGEMLIGKSMTSRRALLRQVLNPEPHRVEISEQRFASTQLDIKKMLLKALEGGHEGIMIKTLDDGYVINERKDKWMKLKPDMLLHHGDDLDLVILGGYYGQGRHRGGKITEFLMGARANPNPLEDPKHTVKFHTFCKVGTGLTEHEYDVLNSKMVWHEWDFDKTDTNSGPSHYMMSQWSKKRDDIPHVWCKPENSHILQIHGYEICQCETMSAGLTVRFPTVERPRPDKEGSM